MSAEAGTNWGFAFWYLPIFVLSFVVLMPIALRELRPKTTTDYAAATFGALVVAWLWIIFVPCALIYFGFAEIGRRFDRRAQGREDPDA